MKLRVLIVEDDRLNAELARDLLEARGHEVELAPDAVTFRALVAGVVDGGARPNIVLMDIRLPDGDGVELLREARGTLVDVPIVAVTAQALAEERLRLATAGFAAVMTKPIDTRAFGPDIERLAAAKPQLL
ncbi:MAG TPA: response regulator [Polyangia bacterium]|jgi:CheY-like chemotaxis protein|nr:response regulator [Polyangia bacterium]